MIRRANLPSANHPAMDGENDSGGYRPQRPQPLQRLKSR